MKWIHNKSEVPNEPHFAIIEFKTLTTTEYDEPYPHNVCDYILFENENEWKIEVEKRTMSVHDRNNFVAVRITPASVKTKVSVSVE